ncbi:hypothetical protein J437_LFUL001872 [Ladona fulva]|uniref:Protein phosphatase 1 regulatory subunit 12A n=1 Tax=Ladona fulva TaxID=123851 RepID=A0A8K0JUW3_LADFU|nr:hypothetical protein J437_LFUL001872 [Ladona fulva]
MEMVEFLVQNGADVNIGDNEGWTPLHATASCGFLSISKFLLENGANVACVNNDGHLPIDIADSDVMEELLNKHIYAQGIDCDKARNEEEQLMLHDAKEWLNSGGDAASKEVPHPKTGATALHVAAAKGYIKVMRVLIQAGCDVDAQDFDGWTPLHAAAHWCVGEACKLLVEDGLCDMDIRNFVGQTAFDVADPELHPPLEELKKRQAGLLGSKRRKKIETSPVDTMPQSPVEAEESTLNDITHKHRPAVSIVKGQELENNRIPTSRTPQNIDGESRDTNIESEEGGTGDSMQRVRRNPAIDDGAVHVDDEDEVLIDKMEESDVGEDEEKEEEDSSSSLATSSSSSTTSSSETSDSSDECEARGSAEKNLSLEEKKNRVNREENVSSPTKNPALSINAHPAPTSPPKVVPAENDDTSGTGSGPSWRRPVSYRGTATRPNSTPSPREETGTKKAATNRTSAPDSQQQQEVILRRTHSFESDEKKGGREDLRVKIGKTDAVTTASTNSTTNAMSSSATSPLPASQVRSSSAPVTPSTPPTTPGGSRLSPGNFLKNFFKSFVPPVRDEESETQRKAHAKRVRETRRSTQGVTLEELKSAEQLVRKQQQQQQHNDATPLNNQSSQPETQQQQFLLEDARSRSGGETVSTPTSTSAYIRRPTSASPSVLSTTTPSSATPRPASVPPEADATVTIALRRQSKPPDDKDQDKENDSRNAQATQAVIQRRRRPKRRSTGVVHVDMDEIDPDRQDSADADDSSKYNSEEKRVNFEYVEYLVKSNYFTHLDVSSHPRQTRIFFHSVVFAVKREKKVSASKKFTN